MDKILKTIEIITKIALIVCSLIYDSQVEQERTAKNSFQAVNKSIISKQQSGIHIMHVCLQNFERTTTNLS